MPAVCLLVLALAVSGCANFQAALRTGATLEGAGYRGVNVNVATGTGEPAGGLISVAYSRGPTGNEQRDAQQAEKIVWDTFPGRFGAVAVIKVSGGCAGPVCATQSSEIADTSYAQLSARFGRRPHGLDSASPAEGVTVPAWVKVLALGLALMVIAAAAIVLTLIFRRKPRQPDPPPSPPGPPDWPGLNYRSP